MINSEKHIVQFPIDTASMGVSTSIEIIRAVDVSDLSGDAFQVSTGTEIKAVFVELWLLTTSTTISSVVVTIEKKPASAPNMTSVNAGNLHDYSNKKNILWTGEGLTGDFNSNPIPVLRQWIKIPKGKQRFGLADQLRLTITPSTQDHNFCGMAIYKART